MIYKTDTVMNCTNKIFFGKIITYLFSDRNLHRVRRYQFTGYDMSQSQLNKFMLQIKELQQHPDAVAFWQEHITTYSCLADTALDFVAAPTSQAYVERVFLVCGMLTQGRRSRMSKSLEMRVQLKLNVQLIG